MNELTKEELELIHEELCYAAGASIETGGMMKDILYRVATKLQFLIDNYCDHEYRHSNEAHFKCINCGLREK